MSKNPSDSSGSAFPQALTLETEFVGSEGMTLRDYFAAQVLPMAAHDIALPEEVACRAYAVADAMLAERQK